MVWPIVLPTMAAAMGARAMPTIFTKGAPIDRALNIWSSKVKPPLTEMAGRYFPLSAKCLAY